MDKIILCFELDNSQDDFAVLMQIIQALETDNDEVDYKEINRMSHVRYCWLKGGEYSAKEIVWNIEKNWEYSDRGKNIWNAYKLSDLKQVVEKKKDYQISYYIRVCNKTDADIKDIQFLLLALQQFPMISNRVLVFWEPFKNYLMGTKESWSSVSSYYKFSHYLRFVLGKYKNIFYSAFYKSKEEKVCIEELSSKKKGVQSTFFPLIEIDSEMYSVFSKYFLCSNGEIVIENEGVDKESKVRDLFEISQRILSKRIEEGLEKKKERDEYTKTIYQRLSIEPLTSLEYAMLSVLIPTKVHITDDEIDACKERARSISNGLIQIIENIILHSSNHKGVFSFRIIKRGKKFLTNILDGESKNDFERVLEIDIADANIYETIIDNFSKKLQSKDYFKHMNLSVAHFFKHVDDEKIEMEWKRFRKDNPVKCLGLERLGTELRLCNAILQVRSDTAYSGEKPHLVYKENAYNYFQFKKKTLKKFIPGTQFTIILPILHFENTKQHNANIFFNSIGNLVETDEAYSNFIKYVAEPYEDNESDVICSNPKRKSKTNRLDSLFYEECTRNTSSGNKKDMMVHMWKGELNKWESQLNPNEKKVYYMDLNDAHEFQSPWGIETFCKGFVDSNLLRSSNLKYVALINCNSKIIQMIFETIMLSENYLGEGIQLYLHNTNCLEDLVIVGENRETIIRNALQFCYAKGNPPEFLKQYAKGVEIKKCRSNIKVNLFPFDVVITEKETELSLFENYIEKVAQNLLIASDKAGYLLSDTHMRLGSKVHLSEFYEVSILFRKPRISRKIALLIIRRMIVEDININTNLLFYGYASYSKTILTALTEIMRYYHKDKSYFVEYVVYQNDIMVQKTLTHINPKVRMYYSRKIPSDIEVNIIQIVPISSTLTTFKKMWDMFLGEHQEHRYKLIKNYTLFWVRDYRKKGLPANKPTDIELEYWTEIGKNRTICTSLITPNPQFFCKRETKWFNPLNCTQCYPKNVLDEKSLVETDVTSTVPSQQLEVEKTKPISKDEKESKYINEIRLVNLRDCVYYGHVSRDGNHFQYYIDTMQYFYNQKACIAKWLGELQKRREKDNKTNELNILVTPQHHTNVEFVHYVNNYYFNGSADIMTIDSAKEYRSNIILKYADVKAAIVTAEELKTRVKFIYVDDTIITGTTYRRVNNLLHSLVPQKNRKPIQFEEVFVLVNRLSSMSRADYVNNVEKDFHAFVDLKISSVRNFGDSCSMCTLQRNSNLFFKRAATTEISRYWNKKKYDYNPVAFDKYTQLNDFENKKEQGYIRMLCSHYAKEQLVINADMKSNIFKLLQLFAEIRIIQNKQIDEENIEAVEKNIDYFKSENVSPIYCCVFKSNIERTIKSYFKVLCRPFFSYGKFYRQAILDLFLVIAESFMNPNFDLKLKDQKAVLSENKEYLNDHELKQEMFDLCLYLKEIFSEKEQQIDFIQDYIIEGLTDLRSNYIIRKNTMDHFKALIVGMSHKELYYRKYARMIHRLINSSSDETKSLWLEYLLVTGKENTSNLNDIRLIETRIMDKDSSFSSFVDSIFIENTRLYYDSMLNFVKCANTNNQKKNLNEETAIAQAVKEMWGDYYIKNLRRIVSLEIHADATTATEKVDDQIETNIKKMAHLLYTLKKETAKGIERYAKLKKCIEGLLYEGDKLHILTSAFEGAKDKEELYAVADYDKGSVQRGIAQRVKEAIQKTSLKNKSFYVGNNYIVLCIDNNENYLREHGIEDSTLTKIQPLYFYIECNTENHFRVILRIRKILMYRYQLLHWIEADFNNNTMPILAEQMGINRQLMRDRAGDHNSSTDILVIEKLLQGERIEGYDDFHRWILLKVYVNMRIARLFRCEWSNTYEEIKEKAYTIEQNADSVNGALKNLGDAIFGDTLKGLSPQRYFELVKDLVCFNIDIADEYKENVSPNEMQKMLSKLNGRCEDGYYYKQEYIICILFDILFNAIRVCRNWDVDLQRFSDVKERNHCKAALPEDDMIAQYYILKQSKDKCSINIHVEDIEGEDIAYLVMKNKVDGKLKDTINKSNEELEENIASKETVGMSIQAMKWYT